MPFLRQFDEYRTRNSEEAIYKMGYMLFGEDKRIVERFYGKKKKKQKEILFDKIIISIYIDFS